jgi:hypothetical protein
MQATHSYWMGFRQYHEILAVGCRAFWVCRPPGLPLVEGIPSNILKPLPPPSASGVRQGEQALQAAESLAGRSSP